MWSKVGYNLPGNFGVDVWSLSGLKVAIAIQEETADMQMFFSFPDGQNV